MSDPLCGVCGKREQHVNHYDGGHLFRAATEEEWTDEMAAATFGQTPDEVIAAHRAGPAPSSTEARAPDPEEKRIEGTEADMRRALVALRLEVPAAVAADVERRVLSAFGEVRGALEAESRAHRATAGGFASAIARADAAERGWKAAQADADALHDAVVEAEMARAAAERTASEMREALGEALDWFAPWDNERYERHAARFHAATGMLAPGKDVRGYDDPEGRQEAWSTWSKAEDRRISTRARALLAAPETKKETTRDE